MSIKKRLHFKFENIKLVSVNKKYNKNFSLAKDYAECKIALGWLFRSQNDKNFKLSGNISVSIEFKGSADIDNYLKVILDSLEDSGIIPDDKNINCLHISRYPKKGRLNDLDLLVWETN